MNSCSYLEICSCIQVSADMSVLYSSFNKIDRLQPLEKKLVQVLTEFVHISLDFSYCCNDRSVGQSVSLRKFIVNAKKIIS